MTKGEKQVNILPVALASILVLPLVYTTNSNAQTARFNFGYDDPQYGTPEGQRERYRMWQRRQPQDDEYTQNRRRHNMRPYSRNHQDDNFE